MCAGLQLSVHVFAAGEVETLQHKEWSTRAPLAGHKVLIALGGLGSEPIAH